jgi:(1->4)-alpha-D-glucan 1-alpha-D-glucosylmutase
MRRAARATYRLQLGPTFGFDDAGALADYLAELGVSHAYLSPCFEAEPGSPHGYDVVDPGRVRDELGGPDGFARMCAAFEAHGVGRLLDVVPNHMSIASVANLWWWDVLENGLSSRYAVYFDVDWAPLSSPSENRILMPILGERYGDALTGGRLRLERRGGAFVVRCGDRVLPAAPRALDDVLRRAAARVHSDELGFYADALKALPLSTSTDVESSRRRHRDKTIIASLLFRLCEDRPDVAAAVDASVAELNADPGELHAFLERQNWRAASWTLAASDLGYRRFFDVTTLVGLRVEDPAVLEDTHRLVVGWLREGVIDGVRVDHIDGLRDPTRYLLTLRASAPAAWIVVEKILAPDETLRPSFAVDGTTGYEFLRLAGGLWLDPAGAAPLGELAERITGESHDFTAVVRECKRLVVRQAMGSELFRLVDLASRALGALPQGRDFSRRDLTGALTELLIAFPVYRTYVRAGEAAGPADADILARVVAAAAAARPDLAPLLDLLRAVLAQEIGHGGDLVERVQQTAAAVIAKGVEDTAFYRHLRLVSLNEVGGAPERFGTSPDEFHRAMATWPHRTLLTTSTHDTKRGEDVRARLAVLSEIPDEWATAVARLRLLAPPGPDPHAEYLVLQTLVGAWPIDEARLIAYLEKAMREAKRRTTWTQVDAAYEEALWAYVRGALASPDLVVELERLVARILPAARRSSLAQTLVKLTAPGVADLYQGTELWDLALVDPDNRRPVDFARRRALLAELRDATPEAALAGMDEGLPKLWLIRRTLRVRARRPAPFDGDYAPLATGGPQADLVLAYVRGGEVATIVPRLGARATPAEPPFPLVPPPPDADVDLPAGTWRNELTGDTVAGGRHALAELLRRFPVALLGRQP